MTPPAARFAPSSHLPAQPTRHRRRRRRGRSLVRRHPAMTVLAGLLALVLVLLLGWLWYLDRELAEIPRFEIDLDGRSGDGTYLLLAGVDNPEAAGRLLSMLQQPDWEPGVFRSDAIMVVHINTDQDRAHVVSIPRDTWVTVPGYGKQKINAAFSYGGPALLATTVQNYAGIPLDHVLVVDMAGFTSITEALGGVAIPTGSGGTRHLDAQEALRYVRERKSLPRGDFDRIQRQQNFLRAVFREVASADTLLNPLRLTELVTDLSDYIAVSDGLTDSRLRSLVLASRGLGSADVGFATIPFQGTDYVRGKSIVRGKRQATRGMFDAIVAGHFQAWLGDHDVDRLPPPGQVN